ncbi:DUF2391 family protein [Candidatus Woesearchaeota archaeon]|nr:DUF2391 family protein [Candidatus Woesearchaeota archaeon]
MAKMPKTKKEIVKVGHHIKEMITVHDGKGKEKYRFIRPLMLKFHLRDILQVIVGASILAIPVGFTEETWRLGETLPLFSVLGFLFLSILFMGAFVYYNYYRDHFKEHWPEFVKRVVFTYVFSFLVVTILLFLLQKTPWTTDWAIAFSRIVLVTFPASMSAAVADMIK